MRKRARGRASDPGPGGRGRLPAPALLGLLLSVGLGAAGCAGREGTETAAEGDPVLLRARAAAALQQDRLEEAERDLRALLRMEPGNVDARANLALVHLRRGELEEAERAAREALERAPGTPGIRLILAAIRRAAGDAEAARRELQAALAADPTNLRARWALAQLEGGPGSEATEGSGRAAAESHLRRLLEAAPGNVAARLFHARLLLEDGEADSVLAHLEELRGIAPAFPPDAEREFQAAVARLRAGDVEGARAPFERFRTRLETTPPYQAALQDLEGPRPEASGFLLFSFSHEISLRVPDEAAVWEGLRLVDGTDASGLGEPAAGARVAAPADFDGDGDEDLFVGGGDAPGRLLRNDLGRFVDLGRGTIPVPADLADAIWGDFDNDGWPDLYLVGRGPNRLFRNRGDGSLEEVTEGAPRDAGAGRTARFVDLDHDGDLDLYVANEEGDRFYRNAGNGVFQERTASAGLGSPEVGGFDIAFADFDDDADLDLAVAAGPAGARLFRNLREGRFEDATSALGLGGTGPARAVATGDYDNDGEFDLAVAGGDPAGLALYRNRGGSFRREDRGEGIALPERFEPAELRFVDVDNDGRLDLLVAGRPGSPGGAGLLLLRNEGDGRFRPAPEKLPAALGGVERIQTFDYNEDGDLDVLVSAEEGPRLLRNDGGNVNHSLRLRLVGRGAGSGKVNRLGIGSRVEVRAADLLQARVAEGPLVHFGLGHRLKADVVRVVWTNGVPQEIYFPGTDQDLIEEQTLKGSCAFVYGWDGERHVFLTDAMWKSAIGMPMGIMTAGGGSRGPGSLEPTSDPGPGAGGPLLERRAYAPPAASREYLRIPGELLRPVDGRYRLQLTEELWEVAYVDEVKLVAIDHPATVELFVDEKFVPPAPPSVRVYAVSRMRPPRTARDGNGRDLLDVIAERDDRYTPAPLAGPYQGISDLHELVLELDSGAATASRLLLFLQGWIFPTDASINVAVAQGGTSPVVPPRLEVPDGRGGWRTAADLGFPAGKDKTVVAELTGLLDPNDPRVRIVTNMQIHWDRIFYATNPELAIEAVGPPERVAETLASGGAAPARISSVLRTAALAPVAADLHHRGFSREFRKGGRYGPHWFDYDRLVERPRWLPIRGRYTRYGSVTGLLTASDDRYVILAPGDEMTVEFSLPEASPPPAGWTRTFLLYTDGWIKDADLNTATGSTVEPLPFHAQTRYPYGVDERFPDDEAHRRWDRRYNTRVIR